MADAESSGNSEHVGATIDSDATWRVLDRVRGEECTQDAYAFRTEGAAGNRLELYGPNGNDCQSNAMPGPSAIAFMDGATSADDVTIRGGGKSAIALGVLFAFDYGDAPESYGEAGAALQSGFEGGEIPTSSGTWSSSNRGVPIFDEVSLAEMSKPAVRLGAEVDDELSPLHSERADGDDLDGTPDDEDGVTVPDLSTVIPGEQFALEVDCQRGRAASFVGSWIDWNSNGTFDEGEGSPTVGCPAGGGPVELVHDVPEDFRADAGEEATQTYMRVRTASSETGAASPEGVTSNGEVEDYTLALTTPSPSLALVKDAGEIQDLDGNGPDAGDTLPFTFTVENTGDTEVSNLVIDDPMLADAGAEITCAVTTLAPGESTDCTADYTLTQGDVDAGTIDNTATAEGEDPRGNDVTSNDSSTSTPLEAEAALLLEKRAADPVDANDNGITDAGDTIDYTFEVTNTGLTTVSNVVVDDPMLSEDPIDCTPGTLAPTESADCGPVTYTITEDDEDARTVENTAVAQGEDPTGPVTSPEDRTTTPVQPAAPVLDLDKTASTPVDANGSGLTDAGDTLEYSFTVTNTGNVTVQDVVVNDEKLSEEPISCDPGSLAPGESADCGPVSYTITEDDETAGAVENTATAQGTDPEGEEVTSPTDSTQTPVATPNPLLGLEKTAGEPVDVNGSGITDAGDSIDYTFEVTNLGNVPLSGIVIDDPKLSDDPIDCTPGTLAPGESAHCGPETYTVTDADEESGSVDNIATATGEDPDGDPTTSPEDPTGTPTEASAAALQIEKTAGAPEDLNGSGITDAGDTIEYTFEVTNSGNVPVSDITVADSKVADGPIDCTPSALAPGESADCGPVMYTVTEEDEAGRVVENTASADGTDPDGDPVESPEDRTQTPTTVPTPHVLLEKNAGAAVDVNSSGLTDAGDTIDFTFTVTNTGNVPLTDVAIDDPMLAALEIPCAQTTLAPGASTDCGAVTYTVTDGDEAAGAVVNTATATGNDPDGDPTESPEDSTSTPTAIPAPLLDLVKTAGEPVDANGSGTTDAGDTIGYTFEVTNTGNVPLTEITLVDEMLAAQDLEISCEQDSLAPGETALCEAAPYPLTQADIDAGLVDNTASVTGEDPDGDPTVPVTSTTTTPLPAGPALDLAKAAELEDTDGDGGADLGEQITYTFTLTNIGNVTLGDLAIDDPMLAEAGSVITCAVSTLAPGASADCTAVHTVTEADLGGGSIVNIAHATGTTPGSEEPVTSPEANAEVPVGEDPEEPAPGEDPEEPTPGEDPEGGGTTPPGEGPGTDAPGAGDSPGDGSDTTGPGNDLALTGFTGRILLVVALAGSLIGVALILISRQRRKP